MKINLTNKQYRSLLKLVFLGDFMVNGPRNYDERVKEFDEIEQYLYSFYKDFQLENCIEKFKEDGCYYATKAFEDELTDYISDYDDMCFIDELIHQLGRRDFLNKYGEDAVGRMSIEERIKKEQPFLDVYSDEIDDNDIENIGIVKK